jgi:hypothetical protein
MQSLKTPTREQIEKAVALLGQPGHYRYFFENLNNPLWIEPLKRKGFFKKPPAVVQDESSGLVQAPPWPESRYLVRMAALEPDLVTSLLLAVADTSNLNVHFDLLDAATRVPGSFAAKLAKQEYPWLSSAPQLPGRFPEKLTEVVTHLTKEKQIDLALHFARSILALDPEHQNVPDTASAGRYRLQHPRSKMDLWDYKGVLQDCVPVLAEAAPIETLNLLADLLESATDLSFVDRTPPDDSSTVWRRAIENHEQNSPHDVRDILVSALRDAAAKIATSSGNDGLSHAVALLEARKWDVFRRIALHLIRVTAESGNSIANDWMTRQAFFDETNLWHEYALLLKDRFGDLPLESQATVLRWIEAGPDLQAYEKLWQTLGRDPMTAADSRLYVGRWQHRKLTMIASYLDGQWKARYEHLLTTFGPIEHPDLHVYSRTYFGPTSPRNVEEIRAMPIEELVEFLRSWWPGPREMRAGGEASPEGLGRILQEAIAEDPTRFAHAAALFVNLHPTYVRAFVEGLRKAVSAKRRFDWSNVLVLCHAAINKVDDEEGPESHFDFDPNWRWTRKAVAGLISSAMQVDDGAGLSITDRDAVWRVLARLIEDSEPDADYEAEYGGSNMDPATLSLNTVRGEAMHAVMGHAIWVRRHFREHGDEREGGLTLMPEVQAVLGSHLNPTHDPSVAVRSVYGQWLPWLLQLDRVWVLGHLSDIFPHQQEYHSLWWAAWETFVTFCQPYGDVLNAIRSEYSYALDQLPADHDDKTAKSAWEHFAAHLMVFHRWDRVKLGDEDRLLERFFDNASPELAAHFVRDQGISLWRAQVEIPKEVIARTIELWEWLRSRWGATPTAQDRAIASAFGAWVASGKFPRAWALNQLVEVLRLTGGVQLDQEVLQQLVADAESEPARALECLDLMLAPDRDGWRIMAWADLAYKILERALQVQGTTRDGAIDIINLLGQRGFMKFGDLLK